MRDKVFSVRHDILRPLNTSSTHARTHAAVHAPCVTSPFRYNRVYVYGTAVYSSRRVWACAHTRTVKALYSRGICSVIVSRIQKP